MSVIDPIILKFAAALGIGLLIGVERERPRDPDLRVRRLASGRLPSVLWPALSVSL